MSRLVVVSNRIGSVRDATTTGGLASALIDALRERGGLWFGWSGKTVSGAPAGPKVRREDNVTLATVDIEANDFEGYYFGFSNRCLWPACHFRPDLIDFDRRSFEAYRRVNAQFAQQLKPMLRDDDIVWIHDYHLFPLARKLRKFGARQRIGFFLHTPVPPHDILVTVPEHALLVRWLFDYDLVGVQTAADVRRLQDYVTREAGGWVAGDDVHAWGRRTRLRAFPIGIDAANFRALAESPGGIRHTRRLVDTLRGGMLAIGVDRLDYSKGLIRRMQAIEILLERQADARGRLEYLQVAPLSRRELKAYHDFRVELEGVAAHINGRFGTVDWTPVRYLNQPLPRRTLAGLFRASRIGLVTPLRDGMNLVAKEYVAAQDEADPGVLVLSRFAGAAEQMGAALLVNPYDPSSVATAIERAQSMPLDERRRRHAELRDGLERHDVARWRASFIAALGADTAHDATAEPTPPEHELTLE